MKPQTTVFLVTFQDAGTPDDPGQAAALLKPFPAPAAAQINLKLHLCLLARSQQWAVIALRAPMPTPPVETPLSCRKQGAARDCLHGDPEGAEQVIIEQKRPLKVI